MCDICNGMTPDERLELTRRVIRDHGWALQVVESRPGHPGWAYTIGLATSFGHPELITIDHDLARAAAVLDDLAELVRAGTRLGPGRMDAAAHLPDEGHVHEVELVAVHEVHVRSEVMAMWHAVHAPLPVEERPRLEALQVRHPVLVAHGGRRLRLRLDQPFAHL